MVSKPAAPGNTVDILIIPKQYLGTLRARFLATVLKQIWPPKLSPGQPYLK